MSENWIVTIAPGRRIEKIVEELTQAGCSIRETLTEIGVVSVTCANKSIEQIRRIQGVADVSPDADIQIPSPDKPVTW